MTFRHPGERRSTASVRFLDRRMEELGGPLAALRLAAMGGAGKPRVQDLPDSRRQGDRRVRTRDDRYAADARLQCACLRRPEEGMGARQERIRDDENRYRRSRATGIARCT